MTRSEHVARMVRIGLDSLPVVVPGLTKDDLVEMAGAIEEAADRYVAFKLVAALAERMGGVPPTERDFNEALWRHSWDSWRR